MTIKTGVFYDAGFKSTYVLPIVPDLKELPSTNMTRTLLSVPALRVSVTDGDTAYFIAVGHETRNTGCAIASTRRVPSKDLHKRPVIVFNDPFLVITELAPNNYLIMANGCSDRIQSILDEQ